MVQDRGPLIVGQAIDTLVPSDIDFDPKPGQLHFISWRTCDTSR